MNVIWNTNFQIEKHLAEEQYQSIFNWEQGDNFARVCAVFNQYVIFMIYQQIHSTHFTFRFTFRPIFSLFDKINKIK